MVREVGTCGTCKFCSYDTDSRDPKHMGICLLSNMVVLTNTNRKCPTWEEWA